MNTFKKTLIYWRKLRNNEIDHGDILAYRLAFIMSKTLLWWTDEDYTKIKPSTKAKYTLLKFRMATCMSLSLFYLALHWDSKPLPLILENVAVGLAAFFSSCAPFIFGYYRNRTSVLMRTINEINRDILKRNHNALENRRISNRMFIGLSIFCTTLQIMTILTFLLFTWQFAKTGQPKFNSFLYQPTPYSFMAFVDGVSYLLCGFWTMSLCTIYLSMYFEFILRISFYFRVNAEEMRKLRRGINIDEATELKKLKSLIKGVNLLYWCVDECSGTLRLLMILYFWLGFATLGIYAAVILSIGIMESLQLLVFPLYLFLFIVSFCGIGQYLKDSADEVRVGIYDCDWYNAPIPFRKLVLNVLTRCTRDTLFSASPFYDMDLLLLTRVLKASYTLIAVFGKAIK